jgi:lipid-A-disaccharide synthase
VTLRLFLVAGEASGDRLGAALIRGLREITDAEIELHGIGGPLMEAEGLRSLFPMEELSVMGLTEILPRLRSLLRRASETTEAVLRVKPDALITIDSPEFCLRVAGRVKAADPRIPTIHYVAPTVWAWRPKRARKMARSIDHVLALFPFEPPYMEAEGMGCDFVGHPVTTEPVASDAEVAAFRAAHEIAPDAALILVLPGSRRSEVARLEPVFRQALDRVLDTHPDARLVLPTTPNVAAEVTERVARWSRPPIVLDPRGRDDAQAEKRAAFRAAHVALAASGTVSLELAAAGTPMVVAYDMSWLSRRIIGALLRVDTVTLVNLVSDTRAVPEFLGPDCRPAPIAEALTRLLTDAAARSAQLDAMDATMRMLGRGQEPPGRRAARAVLEAMA